MLDLPTTGMQRELRFQLSKFSGINSINPKEKGKLKAGMKTMPPELIWTILEFLIPPVIQIQSTRDENAHDCDRYNRPYLTSPPYYIDLLNSTLVSKAWTGFAQQLLHRFVHIGSEEQACLWLVHPWRRWCRTHGLLLDRINKETAIRIISEVPDGLVFLSMDLHEVIPPSFLLLPKLNNLKLLSSKTRFSLASIGTEVPTKFTPESLTFGTGTTYTPPMLDALLPPTRSDALRIVDLSFLTVGEDDALTPVIFSLIPLAHQLEVLRLPRPHTFGAFNSLLNHCTKLEELHLPSWDTEVARNFPDSVQHLKIRVGTVEIHQLHDLVMRNAQLRNVHVPMWVAEGNDKEQHPRIKAEIARKLRTRNGKLKVPGSPHEMADLERTMDHEDFSNYVKARLPFDWDKLMSNIRLTGVVVFDIISTAILVTAAFWTAANLFVGAVGHIIYFIVRGKIYEPTPAPHISRSYSLL
ncbi:hypothetical protein T439DRAFT_327367 [Meredithblackwellia eburnea MCA 4105]